MFFDFELSFILLNVIAVSGSESYEYDPTSQRRIIGGSNVLPNSVLYVASIQYKPSALHYCAGTILHNVWVVTAAHCLAKISAPNQIEILVGTYFLSQGGERYGINQIITHEYYQSPEEGSDIGLIKTDRPIAFNNLVQPIYPADYIPIEGEFLVFGWGWVRYTEAREQALSDYLQVLPVRKLKNNECKTLAQGMTTVLPGQICTLSPPGVGTCFSDSGGPLVMGDRLVGVVSFGQACAKGFPDFYTDVVTFKNWIALQMTLNK